jgi:hypothetical protein
MVETTKRFASKIKRPTGNEPDKMESIGKEDC